MWHRGTRLIYLCAPNGYKRACILLWLYYCCLCAPCPDLKHSTLPHRCEQALIQNEITDIFRDDFAALSEEDGMSGNRKESIISEYQSFTHLTYSKNKVRMLAWAPFQLQTAVSRAKHKGSIISDHQSFTHLTCS